MAYNSDHVAAPGPLATGGILWAPKGTPLPTSATSTLNAAFVRLGLVGEDGLQPAGDAATVTDLRDWSGEIVASVTESRSVTRYDYTLLSIFDPDVAKFIHGTDNVTVTAATASAGTKLAIEEIGADPADGIIVFDMVYEEKRLRIVVPEPSTKVTGEAAFTNNALSGYTCSTTCLPDANGVRSYRYYENNDLTA